MKKTIVLLVIIQCLILVACFALLSVYQPIDTTTAIQCNIVVTNIDYRRRYNASSLYVYDNSTGYRFSKGALASEYCRVFDISKEIDEGDILTITYIEEYGIFGKTNLVIDAFSEDKEYLSYEQYNSGKLIARIILIIFFGVIELVFLAISIFIIKFVFLVSTAPKRPKCIEYKGEHDEKKKKTL